MLVSISIPHDILTQPQKERIQLAVAAIQQAGTKHNSDPHYPAHQAGCNFGIPRSSFGRRLQGMWYCMQ